MVGMPLDPAVQRLFEKVPFEHIADVGVESFRATYLQRAALAPSRVEVFSVEDRLIPGGPEVRVYRPTEASGLGMVLLLHGGGWTVGNLDTHDNLARETAVQTGAIVVSVDYRLAPEHPHPAAVDDCWAALNWVVENAEQLGGDAERLAVAGDSAGGNLAAVLTHRARVSGPSIRFQLLWYPATLLDPSQPSMQANADAPVLNAADIALYQRCYVGDVEPVDPAVVPGRAATFAALPPAYIAVAEFDPLHDDGLAYADLLRSNDVAVQTADHAGLTHGFVGYVQWVPSAAVALAQSLAALTAVL